MKRERDGTKTRRVGTGNTRGHERKNKANVISLHFVVWVANMCRTHRQARVLCVATRLGNYLSMLMWFRLICRRIQSEKFVVVITRWFKYDRDKLWLVYTQSVPVIFEPPCINVSRSKNVVVQNNLCFYLTHYVEISARTKAAATMSMMMMMMIKQQGRKPRAQ
jgi:hypothetical protein